MWAQPKRLISLICLGLVQACAANFTFTYSEATHCEDFQVSWTGGTPPFQLTFVPSFQVQDTITVADDAFSDNHGSFTVPMPLQAGNQTVVVMSDSTGFGSGGVSPVVTVGNSSRSCSSVTTNHFDFHADQALIQCNGFVFSNYDDAVQPVTITGVVVGGSTFVLNPPNNSRRFTWVANIAAGTQVLFFMTDSQNRQGGTTSLLTVQQSQETSCLDSNSPTSATNAPSMTGTSISTPTGGVSASSSSSHIKTGTLVVAIVVPIVAVVILAVGALMWYRRRRRNRGVRVLGRRPHHPELDLAKGDPGSSPEMGEVGSPTSSVPFLHGRSPSADGATTLGSYSPRLPTSATTSQFTDVLSPGPASVYSDSTQGYQYGSMSAHESSHGGSSQYGGSAGSPAAYGSGTSPSARSGGDSSARRKAVEAGVLTPSGHQPLTQFVLHTDLEDSVPPPVPEVVELPPQYSERGPAAHTAASGSDEVQASAAGPSVPPP